MTATTTLDRLAAGTLIPFAGNRAVAVPPELAERFRPGDHLLVVQDSGALLHVPAEQHRIAAGAVGRAHAAFRRMAEVPDEAVTRFFDRFAALLESPEAWAPIAEANAADVERARARGRSTTRLLATERMRADMVAGLRAWRDAGSTRGRVLNRVEHPGWTVEQVVAPLGVVGFVFEGRPNVFADAAGVLRTGNTVVFRIGSDALGTARAIVQHALDPALREAGLPEGAAALVESAEHAAGWAMFADRRLSLAVARGSGAAVAQLGAVARQAGTAVSLHGTGGAWMFADRAADAARFAAVVRNSLDRKVCNTLNTCLIHRDRAAELVPVFLDALHAAGEARGHNCKLHVVAEDWQHLPAHWQEARVRVRRAEGEREEPIAERMAADELGREWEWEDTPEVSLHVVDDLDAAAALFNRHSPQFTASLLSEDRAAHDRFFEAVNAPFVGDGFTRWVDGQYALEKPELGLSNWENGRLFARGAILSGDGVFTVRSRVRQADTSLRR
ncbi:aldehyde dehydrogenase family protein [Roseomonas elaeocarpi]|uniref:Aldehyde dehydrogenase family protein n=1 Tax=Roseomonas elaeocarpi TaxID=907779 RepID=A0ABV6JUV9_9PROT